MLRLLQLIVHNMANFIMVHFGEHTRKACKGEITLYESFLAFLNQLLRLHECFVEVWFLDNQWLVKNRFIAHFSFSEYFQIERALLLFLLIIYRLVLLVRI